MLAIIKLKYPKIIVLGLLLVVLGGLFVWRQLKKPPRYNVILIVCDTLSAKHMSLYGYHRKTTPFLDEFAKSSFVFRQAFSSSNYTFPSHISIFTGINAFTHNMTAGNPNFREVILPKKYLTLPELMTDQGYQTAWFAVLNDYQLSLQRGFERGISFFEHSDPSELSRTLWLSQQAMKKKPFFAFLHFYTVHDPYTPPNPFYGQFNVNPTGHIIAEMDAFNRKINSLKKAASVNNSDNTAVDKLIREFFFSQADIKNEKDLTELEALYDEEVLFLDSLLKTWVERLKQLALYDNTIIIITSDHGEAFNEHGEMMHQTLNQEVLQIPLLFHIPGLKPSESQEMVQNVDILPTLMELLGFPTPAYVEGKSLAPLLKGGTAPLHDVLFARFSGYSGISVQNKRWKLLEGAGNTPTLYEIDKDPFETNNVYDANPHVVNELETLFDKNSLEHSSISEDFK